MNKLEFQLVDKPKTVEWPLVKCPDGFIRKGPFKEIVGAWSEKGAKNANN